MKFLLLTLFALIITQLSAQSNNVGNLIATIVNEDNLGIEDVSLSLLFAKDSAIAKIALSDKQGVASFEGLKYDEYILSVSKIGYEKYLSHKISLDVTHNDIKLPEISLHKSAKELSEVNVVYKKPLIERQLDKLVVNVENSILAAGSSILEVLQRSPGVIVNQETSINLKGKQGVIVMIDGKTSPLTGADLINYLKSIPAANIDKIEIISNPSARYDAAGNAGIINIRFKKDQRQGLNGSLTLSNTQGFYYKYTLATNLNFRKNKWNVFGSYSYSEPKGYTRFYINRKFFDENHNLASVFDQTSFIKQPIKSQNTKLGVDYYMDKSTVIGLLFNANWFMNNRDGFTNALVTSPENILQYTTKTDNTLNEDRFNGFGNFNFKHSFDSLGTELTLDADYGKYRASSFQNFIVKVYDPENMPSSESILKTDQQGKINVRSLKADFVHPLKSMAKIEGGVKTSLVKTDNDIKFFNVVNELTSLDTSKSNHFIYDETINAAYVSYGKSYKQSEFQMGLRLEHTITNGEQITTGEKFSRSYLYLFPSLFVNHKLSETSQMAFSYSRRIDRPDYRQLNPFKIFVDPYTYVVGDPTLHPVLSNTFELSYTFKNKYIASLGYTMSKDVITDVFIQDDITKISYQTPANLQNFDQLTLSTIIPINFKKWLNTNIGADFFWNNYTSKFQGGDLLHKNFSCYINLSNSISLGDNGWSAEVSANYQSKLVWGLFLIDDLGEISIGIQKSSKNKMSSIKLSLNDIFQTNRIAVIVNYQNQDFHTLRTWDARSISLSYTQRFGSKTVAQARKRISGVEEEKKRAS